MTTTLMADTHVDGVALTVLIFFFAVVTLGARVLAFVERRVVAGPLG